MAISCSAFSRGGRPFGSGVVLALWAAYLTIPVAGWGLFGGMPAGPLAAVALTAAWVACYVSRPRQWAVPAALIVVKVGLGSWALLDRGLTAHYYANDAFSPPVEHSTDFPNATFTRIDPTLDFGSAADRDLPLFFLNDFLRFNYYQPTDPNRAVLAYSASWSGHLLVSKGHVDTIVLRGRGVRAAVTIDGDVVAALTPDSDEGRGTVSLASGWRRLLVTVAGPYGAERRFYAGHIDASGRLRPFSGEDVFVGRPARSRIVVDRVVRSVSTGVDVLILVWLGGWGFLALVSRLVASPARAAAACLGIAAVADAMWFAGRSAGRLVLLPGGDDPLTYETHAREILLNGPLMTFGHPLGQGGAFYYQPLYPYVVAGLHRVFGEDFFGVFFVQRLLIAFTVALVWRMTRVLFGERIGAVGLGIAAVVLYGIAGRLAGTLLGEIVFIPLVCLWACQLITLSDAGRSGRWTAWLTGVVGGLATLARSTLLLAWPGVVLVLAMARKRAAQSTAAIGAMTIAGVVVISVATLRNWMVAHAFVPLTTSFGVNFYLGNQPPPGLHVPTYSDADHPMLHWISRDERVQMTLEFANHAPAAFARNLVDKALYTLGFFGAFVPDGHTSPPFVLLWIAASAGVLIVWKTGVTAGRSGWPRAIPGIIAASHFASIVLIFPHHIRLILPFYVLIIPYAAAAAAAGRWFREAGR